MTDTDLIVTNGSIARADVLDACEEAIAFAGDALTKHQKAKLRKTARTIEYVALGDWLTADCGCLVATAWPQFIDELGSFDQRAPEALELVGEQFDVSLLEERNYSIGNYQIVESA